MTVEIDKSKPVLVTGATGFIAGWLVKRLLEEGLTVHAAVRHPGDKPKLAHLEALAARSKGNIRFFDTDLLHEGSYAEAMEDCELVFHTASPFFINVKDPQKELIDPALKGTRNVLEQANRTSSVKRIVLTSSCAAIYCDCADVLAAPNGILTEEIWDKTASINYQPYSYSKTMAEMEAWEIAGEQDRWDLVVINPCGVFGPPLNPRTVTSESINLFKQIGDGSLKFGVPDIGSGVVDVRDVAEAHYKAGFTPAAHGRNIICGHNTSILEIAKIIREKFGDKYKISDKPMPKWLLSLVGPMINRTITRRFVKNNVNLPWRADNSKSIKELGIKYRPMKETLEETFQTLIDNKVI